MKKRLLQRITSLALTVTMVIGMLPITALAVQAPEATPWTQEIINDLAGQGYNLLEGKATPLSGSDLYMYIFSKQMWDGENFVSDVVFIIQPGQGASNTAIPDYSSGSTRPWSQGNPSAIYLADGVTGIGDYAFQNMGTIKKLEIENPSTLKKIGSHAFSGCDALAFTADKPLDLSGIEMLGDYAFSGCSRLKGVTLGQSIQEIPEYAFNACGLTNIQIPASVNSIGAYAFSGNSFNEISTLALPDGLAVIGDHAFYRSLGSPNTTLTSLVIPSSVAEIGAFAFHNYQALSSVTVQGVDTGGDGASQLHTVGDDAFGHDTYTAYSKTDTITDAVNPDITYTGLVGADFYLPEDVTHLFVNGKNCYTGSITPLTHVGTKEPTCEDQGYYEYRQTAPGASIDGSDLVLVIRVPIDALGHDYQLSEHIEASCESGSYDFYICQNDNSHTMNNNMSDDATGHAYELTGLADPILGAGETSLTWTCQHDNHSETRDNCQKEVTIVLDVAPLTGASDQTIGDLTLPEVEDGTLSWANSVSETTSLTAGIIDIPVRFIPDPVTYMEHTGIGPVEGYEGQNLNIRVNVAKAKLDFSNVNFGNARVFVDSNATEGTPISVYAPSLPSDVVAGAPVYQNDMGYTSTIPPVRNTTWSGSVSVTFSYDPEKYEVNAEKKPGADYTFDITAPGQVTITHSYTIVVQTMENLKAEPFQGLFYTGADMVTVHLYSVPYSSDISWEWHEKGNEENHGSGSTTSPANENAVNVVPLQDAGTYIITITVSKDQYSTTRLDPVEVTIGKAPIVTPKGASGLIYTGQEQIGLAEAESDSPYFYSSESVLAGNDAGTYTAYAILKNPANYAWQTGDDNGDGTVEIKWSIAARRVFESTIGSVYLNKIVPYTGSAYKAVTGPSGVGNFFVFNYDADGTLVGMYDKDGDGIVETEAFTITNAQQTNAGEYTVTALLSDTKNFYWQNHPNEQSYSMGGWNIGRMQVNAPTINAENTVYTGKSYQGKVTLTHSAANSGRASSDGILFLGTDHKYYTEPTGGNALENPPINARSGGYYVDAELVFEDGLIPTNYQIIGQSRAMFTISKAELILTAPVSGLEQEYKASPYLIPQPQVDGLKEHDTEDDYSLTYTCTREGETVQDDLLEVTEVGTYSISVSVASDCQNYKSTTPAEYTFTIYRADQTIQLVEQSSGNTILPEDLVTKTLGDLSFTIKGIGYVGETESGAAISYISSDPQTASVDQNGTVVLHRATGDGAPVTITVTATASPDGNYNEKSTAYRLQIGKADPVIQSDDINSIYTGWAIEPEMYQTAILAPGENGADDPNGPLTYQFYKTDTGAENETESERIGAPSDVGEYWLRIDYDGNSNYLPAHKTVKVTIGNASLDVTSIPYNEVYDGAQHPLSDQLVISGLGGAAVQLDSIKFIESDLEPDMQDWAEASVTHIQNVKDSGTYWYQVTAPNYTPKIGYFTVTISPRDLTLSNNMQESDKTKEYDGDAEVKMGSPLHAEIGNTLEGEPITAAATAVYAAGKNAGQNKDITITYTLSFGAGVDPDNYTCRDVEIQDTKQVIETLSGGKITPKPIVVTGVDAVDRDYNGLISVDLTGTPISDGILQADRNLVTLELHSDAAGTIADKNAANTPKIVSVDPSVVALNGEACGNYIVSSVVTESGRDIDVLISKANVTLSVVGAGNNTITMGYTGNPIVLTADIKDPIFDVAGFDSRTDVETVYQQNGTAVTPILVGTYEVAVSLRPEAVNKYSNFNIQPGQCTLEIANAALTVHGTGYEGIYTGNPHDLTEDWIFTSSTGAAVTNPKVTFALKQTGETENPQDKGIWVTADTIIDSQDAEYWYRVEYESHAVCYGSTPIQVTISPASVQVSSDLTTSKSYDGTTIATAANGMVTGGQNGQAIKVTELSAIYDSADAGNNRIITTTYKLTFDDGVNPDNYDYEGEGTVNKNGSTWTIQTTQAGTITRAKVTVEIGDQSTVYIGKKPTVGMEQGTGSSNPGDWYLSDGKVFSQDELGISLRLETANFEVGTYAITGNAANQNYEVTFSGSWAGMDDNRGKAGTFAITPRTVQIIIGGANGVYGNEPVKSADLLTETHSEGDDTGLLNGDTAALFLSQVEIMASAASPVGGTYSIVGTNGTVGNYGVEFQNQGTYTIEPRPIIITIQDKESKYGCDLAPLTYTVSSPDGISPAIVNGDQLTIKLETQATSSSSVASYPIWGTASGDKIENYSITFLGQTPFNNYPDNATYTIRQAKLDITFTSETINVSMGGSVDNQLKFINQDHNDTQLPGKPEGVIVQYKSSDTGVAAVDPYTGAVTVVSPGDVTITAAVTDGGSNYTGEANARYVLHVAPASMGIQVTVTPVAGLVYDGTMKDLVTYTVNPAGAKVVFQVTAADPGDDCRVEQNIPQAQDAGTYTVSWTATMENYETVSGSTSVKVDPALPSQGFTRSQITVPYTQETYDSTQDNMLHIEDKYLEESGAAITYLSSDTTVAQVEENGLGAIVLKHTGSALITARFEKTENFQKQDVSFTLTVTTSQAYIEAVVEDYCVTYDGQPHGSRIQVKSPSEYSIFYSEDQGKTYNLKESPTITDAGSQTIWYQIQAEGYESLNGIQVITIKPKPITLEMIKGVAESYTYTSHQITTPTATVVDGNTLLKADEYTITYGENTEVGLSNDENLATGGGLVQNLRTEELYRYSDSIFQDHRSEPKLSLRCPGPISWLFW